MLPSEAELFIDFGAGNMVQRPNVLAVVDYFSLPIKRFVAYKENKGESVDATKGQQKRSVVLLSNGFILLSSFNVREVSVRLNGTWDAQKRAK